MTTPTAPTLAWHPEHAALVWMTLSATILYTAYHYGLSKEFLCRLLQRRGWEDERAQAGGVLLSKVLGGLLLGAGGVITLAALGEPVGASGITTADPMRTLIWAVAPMPVLLPIVALSARKPAMHVQYPEIRAARWSPALTLASAGAWIAYLLGYELFFRGFLLFGMSRHIGVWPALAIGTALYVFVHLPKPAPETIGTIIMGFGFGAMAIYSGSFIAPFLLHATIAITSETSAARSHPGIVWWAR